MNLSEYMERTRAMCTYPSAGKANADEVAYLVLGLTGEVYELETAVRSLRDVSIWSPTVVGAAHNELVSELGDVCWYVYRLMDIYNLTPIEHDYYLITEFKSLPEIVSRLANKTKNLLRDKLTPETLDDLMSKDLLSFDRIIRAICQRYDLSFEGILDFNIHKLMRRASEVKKEQAADYLFDPQHMPDLGEKLIAEN